MLGGVGILVGGEMGGKGKVLGWWGGGAVASWHWEREKSGGMGALGAPDRSCSARTGVWGVPEGDWNGRCPGRGLGWEWKQGCD